MKNLHLLHLTRRRGRNRTMMVEKVNLQQLFLSTGEHRQHGEIPLRVWNP